MQLAFVINMSIFSCLLFEIVTFIYCLRVV